MKKLLYILLLPFLFLACTNNVLDDDDIPTPPEANNHVLLIKLTYNSPELVTALIMPLESELTASDSLPINIVYNMSGDVGRIALYYQPANEKLFEGSIDLTGFGTQSFPDNMVDGNLIPMLADSLSRPQIDVYQELNVHESIDLAFQDIWSAIHQIESVGYYLADSHKRIGVFLYTPNGVDGDTAEWFYYVIINK